jgi:hypothetical protein
LPEIPAHKRNQAASIVQMVESGRAWITGIRWRAAAWVLGIALATTATVIFTGLAVLPVIGVAAAAAVVSVNRIAARLNKPVCLSCGHDMSGQPIGPAGAPCPTCGALHQPMPGGRQGREQVSGFDGHDDEGSWG